MDNGYARPTKLARELRANATDAERKLWSYLGARRVVGIRFNRQVPIGPFICDFVSRGAKLIIEVDGGQHDANAVADDTRTQLLERHGYRVLRFWNNEVMQNIEGVVNTIERTLADMPSPNPSREREGGKVARTPYPLPQAGGEDSGPIDPDTGTADA